MAPRLRRDEYTVGWICALPVELAAAKAMLDETHENLEHGTDENDENIYCLGSIKGHNVAIVCLPAGRIGNNPAAAVATQMRVTFKGIRFGLMVGIGGGVPSAEVDIRLGDVVVSQPHKSFAGVVQYDAGKTTQSGFERTGSLNSPPQILLSALSTVRANTLLGQNKLSEYISKLSRIPTFQRNKTGADVLFEATYDHEGGQTCDRCNHDRQTTRQPREGEDVVVHYGTIASGNQVMRSAAERDKVSTELGSVLCFEMEAAGLMNSFPCLVVRGICDYADSHKNKKWQAYAAATAAAYAKEVLSVIPTTDVATSHTLGGTIGGLGEPVTTSTYYIPFPKNRYFVGRKDELDVLKQKLMVDRDCQKMSIVGLGGTGKTQVALQFAYTVKEIWPDFSIFWMPALSMETFEQACKDIARALHIPQATDKPEDAKELVRQYLSLVQARRWLLVLDNADDPAIVFGAGRSKGVVDYLPESEKGVVVYTTRTLEVAASLTVGEDTMELEAMNRQDAAEFLEKSLIRKDLLGDDGTTSKLLDELACLPLAITQAAAYLNMNRMPVARYLRLLRSSEQDIVGLMSKEFRDNTRYKDSANAVATTWVVSFSQIQTHDSAAANLLAFMSCIEWKAMPRSILPGVQPDERMERAIGTLCGYSFLARRGDDHREKGDGEEEWYDIHRLVHLATRIWIGQSEGMGKVEEKAVRHVVEVFPATNHENRLVWRTYLPHALRLLQNMRNYDVEEGSALCRKVGNCLLFDGRFQEAVHWLEECCRRRGRLDEDDPIRLYAQQDLAMAYDGNREIKKAEELLKYVIAVQKRVLPEEHGDQLLSQHVLASAYIRDGQVKKAVELLEHVVAVEEKILLEEHPSRLVSQHELARAYSKDGQVKKAVELLEHVAAVREKVLVEEHPDRLASQHALARAYSKDGQVKKAVELLEHVAAVREKVLVEEHPDQLASQHALASAYTKDGQVKKAVDLLEHVVAVREKVLVEEHPSRLASQHELASAYTEDGQVKKAVELLEHVAAVREKVLVEEHPSRLASQHELASAYIKDGQVKKAVELLEHVVAVEEKILLEEHPSRLVSQHELARAYSKDGQVKKAVELLEHVVATEARVLQDDDPERLRSQKLLAKVYGEDGQVKKAIELLEHVVAIQTQFLQNDGLSRLASQHELARAYEADGQVKKAIELLEHVVAIKSQVLQDENPGRLVSQHVLARVYKADGQVKKAVELLEHVVVIEARILQDDDPSRLVSQELLARAYKADGQVEKAAELLKHVDAIKAQSLQNDDDPERLASQELQAQVYEEEGQGEEAVVPPEHIDAIEAQALQNDNDLERLTSQELLADLCTDASPPKRRSIAARVAKVARRMVQRPKR